VIVTNGTTGNDILHGSADVDMMTDEAGGNDELYGEGGDDILRASRSTNVLGSVLLDGGTGRDSITFDAYSPVDAVLRGGDDADRIVSSGGAHVEIDAGSGDDIIEISHEGTAYSITLGSGSDLLAFSGVSWTWSPGPAIAITDFETGATGDRLFLDTFLAKLVGWDSDQNPFATGHLALEQRGSDAVLRVDRAGDGSPIDFIIFQGVSAASLTAFNLGFAPDGSATPGLTINGTGDDDFLYGGGGGDTIEGGVGMDYLYGGAGNDVLNGGDDSDRIYGAFGDDLLNGGAGNDFLWDDGGGDDRLYGGGDDDHLQVNRQDEAASDVLLDGGEGRDSLYFFSSAVRRLDHVTMLGGTGDDHISVDGALIADIDAGDGDDAIDLTLIQTDYRITLGAGADRVSVGNYGFAARWTGQLLFTDFEAGASGDRLDLSDSLLRGKLETWDRVSSPFADGNLVLGQRGADAVILFDRNGGQDGFETLVTFANLSASSLTAFNLGDRALPALLGVVGTDSVDSLTGGAGAEVLLGFGGNDRLSGGGGNDRLLGMDGDDGLIGEGGQDVLIGGKGDDTYLVDDGGDTVIEAAGEGYDRVFTTSNFTLTAGSEVELLSAYDRMATAALSLTGNGFANTLYGNMGANGLIGGGGTDTLYGLGGDDAYIVDDASDVVIELAGQGRDTVYALASYALLASSEVEVLTVYDRTGTAAINLTGSASNNAIYGNMGANGLIGGGGSDVLYGMAGDDTYIVDDASDEVVEAAGQGRDTVYAMGSYALSAGAEVEVLTAYDRAGTAGVKLTGSASDNVIYGNMGANGLVGGGGADTLYGLGGDDSYIVDSASDSVIEFAGQGRDTVYTTSNFALAAGSEVEVLTAYDRAGGTALQLSGNALANVIYGNAGANVLDGKGGADALYGLGGADTFQFTTALQPGSAPAVIGDFATGLDRIALDDAVFGALAPGALSASAFATGSAAADADDRIIYDPLTGALLYDPDGNGAAAAIQFATLQSHPTLAGSDFLIF